MSALTWWREPLSDDVIIVVGGFGEMRLNLREFEREARERFPILASVSLVYERMERAWLEKHIAPLLWLGMPGHDDDMGRD